MNEKRLQGIRGRPSHGSPTEVPRFEEAMGVI